MILAILSLIKKWLTPDFTQFIQPSGVIAHSCDPHFPRFFNFTGMVYYRFTCRFLLVLIVFVQASFQLRSQEYIYNRLSIQDGLLSNNILCIWQDEQGYLWIGTENGLQRYDGYAFRTILNNRIDQILSDNKKRVWIRSGKTIGLFDPRVFSFTEIPCEGTVTSFDPSWFSLYNDAKQNTFLIIRGKSAQYFDEKEKIFNRKSSPFIIPDSLKLINVVEDPLKDRYWVTTFNGMGYWDKHSKKYYSTQNNEQNDPLLSNKKLSGIVSRFFIDKSNRYWIQSWIGSDMNFFCYDVRTNKFTNDTTGLGNAGNGSYYDVYGFTEYDDSSTVVYGLNCLRMRERGEFRELRDTRNNPFGIHFNVANGILQDREKLLWIATDDGLYNTTGNINRNTHLVIDPLNGRASIIHLLEDEKGRIWLGTWGRGVVVTEQEKRSVIPTPSIKNLGASDRFTQMNWSLCQTKSGSIWIGCQEGRLIIYDPATEKSQLHRPKAFNNSTIRQMVMDKNGAVWIGLHNGDLFKCKSPGEPITEFSFYKVHGFGGFISKLLITDHEQIWIAAQGKGLFVVNAKNDSIVQSLNRANIASDIINSINDILPFNDSIYLFAGEHLGSYNSRTGRVESIISYNNLPLGKVYALQKDNNNECWLGTSNGIFKLNPITRNLTKYSQRDGLITVHNNSYIPETSLRLKNGNLVFAGNQHLVSFNPAQYRIQQLPPDVSITGFQLNNHYLREDSLLHLDKIRLSYSASSFHIEFAVLSFLQHDKFTYEYKLEGSKEDWTTLKSPTPVSYNLLPHGNYRFLVRARNSEGLYSKNTTALSIYIAPPFWRTIWFYILVGLVVASILFYLHKLRLQRLLHVERVRSRLARDLHDDMGSTLSTINILSNIALKQIPLEEKTSKEYMSTINNSTTQMMESMDDIVWSINPVNDSLVKVLARMKEVAGSVLEPNNIDYQFHTDNAVKDLNFSMEWRRDIFLLFKEALNNIVKYSKARNVSVTLKKSGKSFQLIVEDDGIGFDINARVSAIRGNGLKNMKKRAETINGQLDVVSEPGKGTRVNLTVHLA
jgi:signal transduction histidine kinase/ligand-binding sensor domain-containing protein